MIDYEKLQNAHELANKLSAYTGMRVDISLVYMDCDDPDYLLTDYRSDAEIYCPNIDDLIAKILEIIPLKPKYKSGDQVWYIDLPVNKIHSAKITKIGDGWYVVNGSENGTKDDFLEEELYPSKSALIEAQFDFWKNLLAEEFEQDISFYCEPICQHESDGNLYDTIPEWAKTMELEARKQYKCIKCRGFYR